MHALTALFKLVVQVYVALGAALATVVQPGGGTTQLRGLVREAQWRAAKGKEAAAVAERLAALGVADPKVAGRTVGGLVRQIHEIRRNHEAKGFALDAALVAEFVEMLPPPSSTPPTRSDAEPPWIRDVAR